MVPLLFIDIYCGLRYYLSSQELKLVWIWARMYGIDLKMFCFVLSVGPCIYLMNVSKQRTRTRCTPALPQCLVLRAQNSLPRGCASHF